MAVRAGILHFGQTGLAFRHALVRDAIVAELGPAERSRAHAGIASALEATGVALLSGLAARHWFEVEGRDAAQRCRDLAAVAARASALAPARGVELAQLALDATRRLGASEEECAGRQLAVTHHAWAAGMLEVALSGCDAGLDLAESAGRPDLMADFALVPQGVASYDIARRAGSMCRRALDALPAPEVTRRARLLALWATWMAEAGQAPAGLGIERTTAGEPTALELSAEALASARASDDPEAELETIAARHFVLSHPQAIEARAELVSRATQLGGSAKTTMGALWCHPWRADLGFQRGELHVVDDAALEVELVAQRRSSPVAH